MLLEDHVGGKEIYFFGGTVFTALHSLKKQSIFYPHTMETRLKMYVDTDT